MCRPAFPGAQEEEPSSAPAANAAALPQQLAQLHPTALAVGLVTIVLVAAWPRVTVPVRAVPGPLVAIVVATALALAWPQVPRVDLPGGLLDALALPVLPDHPRRRPRRTACPRCWAASR